MMKHRLPRPFHPLCGLVLLMLAGGSTATPWPPLEHPQTVRSEVIGGEVYFHGRPLQLGRQLIAASASAVREHYRQQLGTPLAHARVGSTTVLSQQRGAHFLTVSIDALDHDHSEVLLAVARLQPGQRPSLQLPLVLPAGSRLLSALAFRDHGSRSHQLVFHNAHRAELNRRTLDAHLAARGLQPVAATGAAGGRLHYAGAGGNAEMQLLEDSDGTTVLLTLREHE